MARWRLDVGPAGRAPSAPLSTARGLSFDFNLTEPSTGTFTVNGRHDDARHLQELVTDAHLLRNGVPLWTGRVMAVTDTIDDTKHRSTVTCTDLRGVLDRRKTRTPRDWSGGIDVVAAATALLEEAQAPPYSDLGYTVPSLSSAGRTVYRKVEFGQSMLTELQALQGGTDGGSSVFDWDITPGWTDRVAQLWIPQRGRDLTGPGGLTLQYREARPGARVAAFGTIQRGFDPATYANVLTVTGGVRQEQRFLTSTDPDTGEVVTETITIDIPTTPVTVTDEAEVAALGSWPAAEAYPDIVWQDELIAKAQARLAELARVAATYSFPLRQGFWEGPDQLWLGDTVRVVLQSGRVQDDVALRVTKLGLQLDPSGAEQVTVTVGPAWTPADEWVAMSRRLTALEQH